MGNLGAGGATGSVCGRDSGGFGFKLTSGFVFEVRLGAGIDSSSCAGCGIAGCGMGDRVLASVVVIRGAAIGSLDCTG